MDYVVEGEHAPQPQFPEAKPALEDTRIEELIVPQIPFGATLQLGIGGMPNVAGSLLPQSDLRALGMHTELCGDACYELFKAGKLTNRRKTLLPDKGVTGIVFDSQALYDWVDQNPGVIVEPLEYVNALKIIGQQENTISINSWGRTAPVFGNCLNKESFSFRKKYCPPVVSAMTGVSLK